MEDEVSAPAQVPEGYLDVSGLAELAGQSVVSVRHALRRCRDHRAQTARRRWPVEVMPRPDKGVDGGVPVLWRGDREDVQSWAADKRSAAPPALLYDRRWLLTQYGHPEGLHGRPRVRGGKARSMAAMAKDLGVAKSTIRIALAREEIPVPEQPEGQRKGVRGKLADVPLSDLEAALSAHGTVGAAAASLEVSHMTFRTALRVKRAEAGLTAGSSGG